MTESLTENPPALEWTRPVLLRQAREAAGLHIAALAAALKVPVRKLESLEAGRYDELPDMTFARALASSACRHLKVDPAPVLEQIPVAHTAVLGDDPHGINAPFKSPPLGLAFNPSEWLRRPAVLIAGAVLIAAAGLLYMPDPGPMFEAVKTTVSGWMPAEDVPKAEALVTSSPAVVQETVLPAADVSAAPVGGGSVVASVGAGVEPAAVSDTVLSLTATGDSWVQVENSAGVSLVQRMLKTGDVLSFSEAPPYAVVLGRADAVQVSVRGQAFDVMPFARNSVARFQVK